MSSPIIELLEVPAGNAPSRKDDLWQHYLDANPGSRPAVYSGPNHTPFGRINIYVVAVWTDSSVYNSFNQESDGPVSEIGTRMSTEMPDFSTQQVLCAEWTTITTWSLKSPGDTEEVEQIMSEYTQAIQDVFQDSGASWGFVEDAENIQFLSMYGTEESGRHWSDLHSPENPAVFKAFRELCKKANPEVQWVKLNSIF